MNVKKKKMSPVVASGIGVGITLVIAALGWFLLVSPQRSRSAELDEQIAAVEQEIATARSAALKAGDAEPIRVADLFRLTKAMPSDNDIAGVMLELSRVAGEAGISFERITPQGTSTNGTIRVQPIELSFVGNYYSLSDFLYRLRNLVSVQQGRLLANGRLFAVDSISFAEDTSGFPNILATIKVSAFLYGTAPVAGAPPVSAAAPAAPAGTDTTATTPTTTDTTATATTPTTTDTTATTTTPTTETPPATPTDAPSAAPAP